MRFGTRPAAIHLLALALALFPGTAMGEAPAHHGAHDPSKMDLPGAAPLPGESIYQLEGDWTDTAGQRVPLARLRGQPVLALMFYGTCQHACPILVRDLQKLEAALAARDRKRTHFLLVSFDPERDTPAALRAYAEEHALDPARWHLLHGDPDQVRALALVLGVRYRPTGDGEFSHTMRITLLDADGVVERSTDGLSQPPEPLAAAVRALLKDDHGAHADPETAE